MSGVRWFGLLYFCCLGLASAQPFSTSCPVSTTNTTTTSVSAAEVDTTNTTNATQRVDNYMVELKARMQGGAVLFDQTYNVALTDPQVQAAITQAQNLLTGAGARSFTGPTQLSSSTSLVSSSTNTVQTGKQTNQAIVNTKAFIGPLNITTGNLGVCQGYTSDSSGYPLPTGCNPGGLSCPINAGGVDFDTRILTPVTISQTATTTSTYLTTQVYELDGFVQSTPPATPVPPSLLLALTGLAGAGLYLARRRRHRLS